MNFTVVEKWINFRFISREDREYPTYQKDRFTYKQLLEKQKEKKLYG